MPLFATAAFPSKTGQIIQRNGWTSVPDSRSFVTARAKQNYFCKLFRLLVPTRVCRSNEFAVVTPGVWEWLLFRRFVTIEAQPDALANEMCANERLLAFAMD